MSQGFDYSEAKDNLVKKEQKKKELLEEARVDVLEKAILILKEIFSGENVEVFLVGSIIVPGKFNDNSDVDIVLKNFNGDRFDVWAELERKIGRKVEVILYEKCSFQDYIDQNKFKVL